MSLHNDYLINIVMKQRHAELLARAAEERLARQLPRRRSAPWWRRLVDRWTDLRWRRPGGASTGRAMRVRTVPANSGAGQD